MQNARTTSAANPSRCRMKWIPSLMLFRTDAREVGGNKLHMDHEQRNNHRQVRNSIQRKTPCGPKRRVGEAADHWAQYARQVELDGVHGNRIRRSLPSTSVGAVPNRPVRQTTARSPPGRRARRYTTLVMCACKRERPERTRTSSGCTATRAASWSDPCDLRRPRQRARQHDRQLTKKKIQAQVKRIFG